MPSPPSQPTEVSILLEIRHLYNIDQQLKHPTRSKIVRIAKQEPPQTMQISMSPKQGTTLLESLPPTAAGELLQRLAVAGNDPCQNKRRTFSSA